MKYNFYKKLNVIFTGHFLKVWYVIFAFIVLTMIWNNWRLKNVTEFALTLYDSSGTAVSEQTVTKEEVSDMLMRRTLPVTKSFIPVK